MVSKKLLFSAVAVLAFNGVAMANSAEVKELTILNNELKIDPVTEETTPCQDNAISYYESVIKLRGGVEDTALLSSLMYHCLN